MLGSGYAKRIIPLIVDGKEIPIEQTIFILDGQETRFDSVTNQHPFTLPMNTVIGVVVKKEKLKLKLLRILLLPKLLWLTRNYM